MAVEERGPRPEREQTDESLRAERAKTDEALDEIVSAIDDYADAIVAKARGQAALVLAAARKSPPQRASQAPIPLTKTEVARAEAELRVASEEADEALRLEREEQLGLLGRERDETDKDLERERERADDALATRDELLGVVSHDLRTMLQAVMGFAGLIAESPSADVERARGHARRIQRAGARMGRLIGDLVDVASIEAGVLRVTPERAELAELVRESVDTFQAQAEPAGITLVAEIAAPLPAVAFDHARVHQVLVNLLSNAIKFTPSGGHVVVRAERVGAEVHVTVSDTGRGIPADRRTAIFERYRQVAEDRRGLGLGLYISKCIVQGHGGRIWVESALGEGSRFVFTLPLSPRPAPQSTT